MEIPEEEFNIFSEQDDDSFWTVRIIHIPTGTIKISDPHWSKAVAEEQAKEELVELIKERQEGLGS